MFESTAAFYSGGEDEEEEEKGQEEEEWIERGGGRDGTRCPQNNQAINIRNDREVRGLVCLV